MPAGLHRRHHRRGEPHRDSPHCRAALETGGIPTGSPIDLHAHTTASDGTDTPAALVDLAGRRGIHVLAVTDHDSTAGLDEAIARGTALGITVVPGVEFSTSVSAGELHLLGYFIDYHHAEFQRQLSDFREGRSRRVVRMIKQLGAIGIPVDLAEVEQFAGDGSVGRAHIARVLVRHGQAVSVDDAFERLLNRGRPGYVERPRLTPVDAVRLVHLVGGAAVLAHPFTVADLEATLVELVDADLDGIEVFYAAYDADQRARLRRYAEQYGLVSTGGSDYHGAGEHGGAELGSAPVPSDSIQQLRARAGASGAR